eukprot:g3482.t1
MTARGIGLRGNNPSQQMPNNFMSLIEMRVECNKKCQKRKEREKEEQGNDNSEKDNKNDNNEKDDGVPNKCIKEHKLKGNFSWGTAYYPFVKAKGSKGRIDLGKDSKGRTKLGNLKVNTAALTDAMSGEDESNRMRKFLDFSLVTQPDNKNTVYKYDCTDEDQQETGLCEMMKEETETCNCEDYKTRVLKALGCTGVNAEEKCTIDECEYNLIDKRRKNGKVKITPDIVNKLLEGTKKGNLKFTRIMLTIECEGEQLKFSLDEKKFDVSKEGGIEKANDEIQDTKRRRRLLNLGQAGC